MSRKTCVDCGEKYYGAPESELCERCTNEIEEASANETAELRKCKAIAELAVKVLEKLSQTNTTNFSEIRTWKKTQPDPDVHDLDWFNHISRSALAEIKRISTEGVSQ